MCITEADRQLLRLFAISTTVEALNLPSDLTEKPADQLRAILGIDSVTYQLLMAFLRAWDRWFHFHSCMERRVKTSPITLLEQRALHAIIEEKVRSRTAILSRLEEVRSRRVVP